MPLVLVTFDLEGADALARENGYEALRSIGLSRFAPTSPHKLPESSVLGHFKGDAKTAEEIRTILVALLAKSTKAEVTHLVVGIVSDFAGLGDQDPEAWLQEVTSAAAADWLLEQASNFERQVRTALRESIVQQRKGKKSF